MDPFLGEIRMHAGNYAPQGWALCDGAILPIQQFTALFSLLGTSFGGNGTTNFGLPNLRDRVPIAWGSGPGLTPRDLGESGGSASVAILSSEMAPHTHAPAASTAVGTSVSPANALWSASSTRDKQFSPGPGNQDMAPATLFLAGGSQPHPNQQPYLTVTYIIAMEGIYPARP